MHTRRELLATVVAGLGAAALAPRLAAQKEIKTTLNGPVGLQLWSLRGFPPERPRGDARARSARWVSRRSEAAGLWGATLAEHARRARRGRPAVPLGAPRLRSPRDNPSGAIAEAKGLGAVWAVCGLESAQQKTVGREDILKAGRRVQRLCYRRLKRGAPLCVSLPRVRVRALSRRYSCFETLRRRRRPGARGLPGRRLPLLSRRNGPHEAQSNGPRAESSAYTSRT